MNSNPQFQISSKRNGKLSQSLNQRYANGVESSDEEKVLKEIKKLVAAGQRRAIVIIAGAIASSSAMVFFLSTRPPIYQGKFQLLVEPVTAAENKLLSVVSQTLGITNPKTNESLDYESQIRVLKSPRLMMPIIDNIRNKYPDVDKNFAEQIKIERIMKEDEGTKILEISYSDKNPNKVQFVLDEISKA
ncbi:MAG TPA: protein tyrosine kinase, partial [Cyanobacteria bacterium UBA11369]|nr:protein tyrosine kinase [Cyanobacteria bacterium UBA11369]